jgi:quinoprotein glucose dehydrogenase
MSERIIPPERSSGVHILIIAAAAGLALSVFNYFWIGNGIHGSAGALLVVISSLLMFAASAALLFADGMRHGVRGTLVVLILFDILGTGLAAYMLEAYWLIAAMAAALAGSIVRLVVDRAPESMTQRGAA